MVIKIPDLSIGEDCSIKEAMTCIDRNRKGIVLIVDEAERLISTITDGDVRRAVLDGIDLSKPISALLKRKISTPPITAKAGTDHASLIKLMQKYLIHQVPLLDDNGHLVDMVTMEDVLPDEILPLQAVIMAGGEGSRLRPLTEDIPKPMLPIDDKPLLEVMIEQLREAGIHKMNLTTHYKKEVLTEHFKDGKDFGVEINYVNEDQPLGTAGALSLLKTGDEPLLVINGDILTRLNFRAMLDFHKKHKAELTVGVRQYDLNIPYGVVECDGEKIKTLSEKPVYNFLVNAGVYLLEPSAHEFIPNSQRFDMTELIERLIKEGRPVVSFPIVEYWLDIGELPQYEQANEDVKSGRFKNK